MAPGRSSDSLRAVLLSATSGSGSSGLTWHSLRSATATGVVDPPGHFFPAKLALSTGLVKIFFSLLMLCLGGLAIIMKAALSSLGTGIWVGIVVGVSGFLGVCASRRPYSHVYVVSFMSVSILSLAASGLLVVLSATAWARDSKSPQVFLFDKETNSEVDILGEILVQRPSILVSGLLVILGIFDILTSLACVALSAKEACGADTGNMGMVTAHEGHNKKERLYRWLGQQKNIFQVASNPNGTKGVSSVSQFVPLTSTRESPPFRKTSAHHSSGYLAEPLLRQVKIKSNSKSSDPSSIPAGSSSRTSSGTTLHQANAIRSPKTSKASNSSGNSSDQTKSSVIFIHPELNHNLKEPILIEKKIRKKKSLSTRELHSLPSSVTLDASHKQFHQRQHPPNCLYPMNQESYFHGSQNFYPFQSLPCPQHPYATQQLPSSLYYPYMMPPMIAHYPRVEGGVHMGRKQRKLIEMHDYKNQKRRNKEKREKRKRREERARKKNMPLTDKQIENSYTGLDREIAEGFISFAMEPAVSQRKVTLSSSDHDSI